MVLVVSVLLLSNDYLLHVQPLQVQLVQVHFLQSPDLQASQLQVQFVFSIIFYFAD